MFQKLHCSWNTSSCSKATNSCYSLRFKHRDTQAGSLHALQTIPTQTFQGIPTEIFQNSVPCLLGQEQNHSIVCVRCGHINLFDVDETLQQGHLSLASSCQNCWLAHRTVQNCWWSAWKENIVQTVIKNQVLFWVHFFVKKMNKKVAFSFWFSSLCCFHPTMVFWACFSKSLFPLQTIYQLGIPAWILCLFLFFMFVLVPFPIWKPIVLTTM